MSRRGENGGKLFLLRRSSGRDLVSNKKARKNGLASLPFWSGETGNDKMKKLVSTKFACQCKAIFEFNIKQPKNFEPSFFAFLCPICKAEFGLKYIKPKKSENRKPYEMRVEVTLRKQGTGIIAPLIEKKAQ